MGDKITLTVSEREVRGKKVTKLRRDGLVPGVVYGSELEPTNIQADKVAVAKVVAAAGRHTPVQLTIGTKTRIAMIKDVDFDPLRNSIRHVSFHAVKAGDVVTATVPIHLIGQGESEAEKAGLVILQAIEHIEIKAKPADLPEALELSVAGLVTADDKLTLGDITLPKGIEYADQEQDLELVVANVYEPSALQAANDAAGGDEEASVNDVESENGEDTPQGGEDQSENPGGKKAKEDHGE